MLTSCIKNESEKLSYLLCKGNIQFWMGGASCTALFDSRSLTSYSSNGNSRDHELAFFHENDNKNIYYYSNEYVSRWHISGDSLLSLTSKSRFQKDILIKWKILLINEELLVLKDSEENRLVYVRVKNKVTISKLSYEEYIKKLMMFGK